MHCSECDNKVVLEVDFARISPNSNSGKLTRSRSEQFRPKFVASCECSLAPVRNLDSNVVQTKVEGSDFPDVWRE